MDHTLSISAAFGANYNTIAEAQKRRAWYTKFADWQNKPRLAREVRRIDLEIAKLERENTQPSTFRL